MAKSHYIIPIFVPHEGCPHNCIFCNQNTITGSSNIINEEFVNRTIEEYLSTIPKEGSTIEVSFFGGTFTAIPMEKQKELLQVTQKYKNANKIDYIRLSTRPDYIDINILDNLVNYEVDIIELGVQSLDNDVLRKSARGHSEEDVIIASSLIKEKGFTLGHQIMLGLPGDTPTKDFQTTEKLIKLKPDIARIYPALVIRNTPMEDLYNRGLYSAYSLDDTIEICKYVYGRLTYENIKVIRMGLQPTEEINFGKEIVNGPFHPAFGELVIGSMINDMIVDSVQKGISDSLLIKINSRDISKLYCNRKKYFDDIKKQLNLKNTNVVQDDTLAIGELIIEDDTSCNKISFTDYIVKKYSEGYLR